MNKNLSDHDFVLCNQDGVLVGHDVLSSEKKYFQPCSLHVLITPGKDFPSSLKKKKSLIAGYLQRCVLYHCQLINFLD